MSLNHYIILSFFNQKAGKFLHNVLELLHYDVDGFIYRMLHKSTYFDTFFEKAF